MTDEQTAEQLASEMKPLSTEETKPVETQTASPAKKAPPRKISAKAKKAPAVKKAAAKKTPDENQITLKTLAKEHKLSTGAARRKLRAAGLKADGRWAWTKGSNDLKKAAAALAATDKE